MLKPFEQLSKRERVIPLGCRVCWFCHFPKCTLVNIRIKGEVGAVKLV